VCTRRPLKDTIVVGVSNDKEEAVGIARRKEDVWRLPNAVTILQDLEQTSIDKAIVVDRFVRNSLD
jgi:hypothetical protein